MLVPSAVSGAMGMKVSEFKLHNAWETRAVLASVGKINALGALGHAALPSLKTIALLGISTSDKLLKQVKKNDE